MMNFMGSSSNRPGFHEEGQLGMLPFAHSSSSSASSSSSPSSSHCKELPLIPPTYPPQRSNLEDEDDELDHVHPGSASAAATVAAGRDAAVIEREHMFDKVVTPSDVGKLNRLVIPKQHAERYFPLGSSSNEKGLLLNFEDRNGKPWRFRYSYWNSSQSYVMTKGWSRFVKDKKLDAGDIVSFQRGAAESFRDRFFIDWRRRLDVPADLYPPPPPSPFPTLSGFPHHFPNYHWNYHHHHQQHHYHHHQHQPLFLQPPSPSHNSPIVFNHGNRPYPYMSGLIGPCSSSVIYLRSAAAAGMGGNPPAAAGEGDDPRQAGAMVQAGQKGGGVEGMVFESVPLVQGKATVSAAAESKRSLRLFGVNMECCPNLESNECESFSLTTHSTTAISLPPSDPNPSLQLSPNNHNVPEIPPQFLNKGKSSSMSLDL